MLLLLQAVILVLCALTISAHSSNSFDPLSDEYIEHINSKSSTWKAGRNFPANTPIKNIRKLLGVRPRLVHQKKTPVTKYYSGKSKLPEQFDSREKWPNCPTIKQIRDQGACGSCWAVTVAETISDRICIHSNGSVIVPISAEYLLSCSNVGSCEGGFTDLAWEFWVENGIITGGPYQSNQGCQPYEIRSCPVHLSSDCGLEPTPACHINECTNNEYNVSYENDLHYGIEYHLLPFDEEQIKYEIFNYGPVEAEFAVFDDFIHYKTGVYQRTSYFPLGDHSSKILGWGVENETPYWLATNTWNENWGDSGYFKILRGDDECFIEQNVKGGTPKL